MRLDPQGLKPLSFRRSFTARLPAPDRDGPGKPCPDGPPRSGTGRGYQETTVFETGFNQAFTYLLKKSIVRCQASSALALSYRGVVSLWNP